MVEGSRDNIKVTYPEDVNLVRFILEEQGRIKNWWELDMDMMHTFLYLEVG